MLFDNQKRDPASPSAPAGPGSAERAPPRPSLRPAISSATFVTREWGRPEQGRPHNTNYTCRDEDSGAGEGNKS